MVAARPGWLLGLPGAIARSRILRSPLVLADEPTGNLDTKSADGVVETVDGRIASDKRRR